MDALTGRTTKRQLALSKASQEATKERLAAEAAKVAKVEAGQRQVAERGGGLLAYVDETLKSTLGS